MGIGRSSYRPKGQANSQAPFLICWQFLKSWQLWKMKFGKMFPDMQGYIKLVIWGV